MTRPLPAYTMRPIKRHSVRKSTTNTERASNAGAVRASRRSIKSPMDRERPELRVLARN